MILCIDSSSELHGTVGFSYFELFYLSPCFICMGCGMSKKDKDSDSNKGDQNDDKQKKDTKGGKDVDSNFKPINILVYRNGDEFDPGTIVAVTRRRFRNWVTLLDYLTPRLRMVEGAVHTLFTLEGQEIRHFKDIEDGTRYVAAHNRMKEANYGTRKNPKWNSDGYYKDPDPGAIESRESLTKYLEQREFRPTLDDMWEDSEFDLRRGGGGKKKEEKKDDWDGVDHSKDNQKDKENEKRNESRRKDDRKDDRRQKDRERDDRRDDDRKDDRKRQDREKDRSKNNTSNSSRRSTSHSDPGRNQEKDKDNRKDRRRNDTSSSR